MESFSPRFSILFSALSLQMRAFDVTESDGSEFAIYFCSADAAMDWMPLLSDWDLDMAILSSAEPALSLFVAEKKAKVDILPLQKTHAWMGLLRYIKFQKLFNPFDVRAPSELADLAITVASSSGHGGGGATKLPCSDTESCDVTVPADAVSQEMPEGSIASTSGVSSPAMFASLRQQVEKTLPSFTNKLNRVFTVAEENIIPKGQEVSEQRDSSWRYFYLHQDGGNENCYFYRCYLSLTLRLMVNK